ncbi:type I restriction enzyme S subunit [Arthrobacter stackebrandtii]|uniref:Type I restriction enzyme S subunit n=1 Tax=Arthrobacter stackebrandtii TaxID=272161 RepID=A0ABS4YWF7_9MICC|nr:restriction endonuclease subunit S [Arthrobacter stackebrandtii]MBP2413054.1 type I restriction enzyme S subunit [Arthrobacter stackebrandtii]PYH01172.1 hypothetical protein CVV67_06170 [Arthrobacter stackebrandtii]
MSEWQSYRLSEFASVITGATPSASQSDSWGDYLDFITPSDQSDALREASPARRLSPAGAERLSSRIVPKQATNLTCIGSTIGKVSMATSPAVTNQQINSIVALEGQSDPKFIYYLIKGWSGALKQHAAGSATPIVNKTDLSNFSFLIPGLPTQQAIGDVLGALDDKIAANTKLAATADELTTSLYRHALAEAAWSEQTFADISLVSGGGTPSTKTAEFWDGDIPWATPTDVTGLQGPYLESTTRTISADGLAACASSLYPKGSILMTSRATIGAFALAQVPMATNQGFIVVQPNDPALNFWVFHEMRSRVDEFISLANGATFLELSRGNFKKFRVRLASEAVMAEFCKQAEALHGSARTALLENQALAATRDALLPQLMSGKLRVKDAESIVSAAV